MASLSSAGASKSPTMNVLENQIQILEREIELLEIELSNILKKKKGLPPQIQKNYESDDRNLVINTIKERLKKREEKLSKLKRERADSNYSTRQQISGDFDKKVFNTFGTNDPDGIMKFISEKENEAMMEPIDSIHLTFESIHLTFESIKLGIYNDVCWEKIKSLFPRINEKIIIEIINILIYKCIAFVIPFINDCIASTVKILELDKTLHQMPVEIIKANIITLRQQMKNINFYKLNKVTQDHNINCIKFIECILKVNLKKKKNILTRDLLGMTNNIIGTYTRYINLDVKTLIEKYENHLTTKIFDDAEVAAATAAAVSIRRPSTATTILNKFKNPFGKKGKKGGTRKKRKRKRKKTRRKHKKKTIRKKRRKKKQKTRRK